MSNLSRLLILSNSPFEHTGYGRQTRYLCDLFTDLGYEVGVVALHGLQGGAIRWKDIPIFPARNAPYALDVIGHYAEWFNADAVITLFDLWHFPMNTAQLIGVPWIAMVPIEGAPIRGRLPKLLRTAEYVVTYSQFGADTLFEGPRIPSTMIPHVVDTYLYVPGDKQKARKALGFAPNETVFTIVGMNKGMAPFRKAWPQMMRAWADFSASHDAVRLYLHSNRVGYCPSPDDAFYFDPLIEDLDIDYNTIAFPDPQNFAVGIDDAEMVKIYQASDIVMLPSMAEGFGLPIIEAQACGVPMIAHDCSAMSELVYNGALIERGDPLWIPQRQYWWHRPYVRDIVLQMEIMYKERIVNDLGKEVNEAGRQHMVNNYSLGAVYPKWDHFLDQVGSELW